MIFSSLLFGLTAAQQCKVINRQIIGENLIKNGDFKSKSNSIAPWTSTGGFQINQPDSKWLKEVNLGLNSGTNAATISQTVGTVKGKSYMLRYFLFQDRRCNHQSDFLSSATIDDKSYPSKQTSSLTSNLKILLPEEKMIFFTATKDQSKIQFRSTTLAAAKGNCGPVIFKVGLWETNAD